LFLIAKFKLTKLNKSLDKNMETRPSTNLPPVATEYNGKDRNAFLFGFNPQAELWNGRLAMVGFLAYLLWDLAGYSVVRDVLHLVSY
jgi:Chlorophyll A-B binding protein